MKQSQENDLNLRLNNSDNVANASAENQQDPLDDYTSFFNSKNKSTKRFKVDEDNEKQIPSPSLQEQNEIIQPEEQALPINEPISQSNVEKEEHEENVHNEDNCKEDKRNQKDTQKEAELLIDKLRIINTLDQLQQNFTQDEIKTALVTLGVKQGGRPEERAQRLLQVIQYLDHLDKIPKNLMAKKTK